MFRAKKTRFLFSIFCMFVSVQCTSTSSGGSQADVPRSPAADSDYAPIEKKWTREVHVYKDFQKRVDAFALLFTDEMRRAFATRWQSLHGNQITSLEDLGQGKLGIVVSAFTPEFPYSKLDDAKIWGIQLSWGEQKFSPSLVKHLSQKAQFEPYFSFVNFWSREYLLLFDVNPSTEPSQAAMVVPTQVTLQLKSALAAVEFVWK